MAGDNQHHIPQFLRRSFGIARSGKPKEIWTYHADGVAERGEIKLTASAHHFYSAPSDAAAHCVAIHIDLTKEIDDFNKIATIKALSPDLRKKLTTMVFRIMVRKSISTPICRPAWTQMFACRGRQIWEWRHPGSGVVQLVASAGKALFVATAAELAAFGEDITFGTDSTI